MIRPLQLLRLIQINGILLRYAFTPLVIGTVSPTWRRLSYLNPWRFKKTTASRAESLRIMLEELGPIFVKFGQLLSTRRDLFPDEVADELAKLQDQVPPFPSDKAVAIIESTYGKPIAACFHQFDRHPLASASISQVHAAILHTGEEVVVKILRPDILKTIQQDIALMKTGARLAQRFWKHGRRLKPLEVVAEFEHTIIHELDLMAEAANASQLRRNFQDSKKMYVPKVYWEYARQNILVMERIRGIRISDIAALRAARTNLKKLAEYGVEIFFTQILEHSFFHADMHPGNLFVDATDPENPKYLGVDFGIMGSLSPRDQHYLAENLLAFFKRDYRRVAILHIDSGWVSPHTRIDQFESAIRTVSEPIFERPLKDISFGQLLLRLFQTAEQFNMEIQPQLFLLQKTLLSIEGLGRQLYPDLDLWKTAKPFLEKWLRKQRSVRHIVKTNFQSFPMMIEKLVQIPTLLHGVLTDKQEHQRKSSPTSSKKRSTIPQWLLSFGIIGIAGFIATLIVNLPRTPWTWTLLGVSGLLLLSGTWASRKKR